MTPPAAKEDQTKNTTSSVGKKPPTLAAFVSLFFLILFFSGVAKHLGEPFLFLDYATLVGRFGEVSQSTTFLGTGGSGARGALLYAASFIPSLMLAVGVIELATHLGALEAAQALLTPVLRPLMGVPGASAVAIIASLMSSDAGAAATRELVDNKMASEKERTILCAFEFSSGASVIFYLTVASVLFSLLPINYLVPLLVVLLFKVIGANLVRLYLKRKEPR